MWAMCQKASFPSEQLTKERHKRACLLNLNMNACVIVYSKINFCFLKIKESRKVCHNILSFFKIGKNNFITAELLCSCSMICLSIFKKLRQYLPFLFDLFFYIQHQDWAFPKSSCVFRVHTIHTCNAGLSTIQKHGYL